MNIDNNDNDGHYVAAPMSQRIISKLMDMIISVTEYYTTNYDGNCGYDDRMKLWNQFMEMVNVAHDSNFNFFTNHRTAVLGWGQF